MRIICIIGILMLAGCRINEESLYVKSISSSTTTEGIIYTYVITDIEGNGFQLFSKEKLNLGIGDEVAIVKKER